MDKIRLAVGMYVRTKFGVIDKIANVIVDYSKELIQCENRNISKHQIVKTSHNIVGLLELGDYVNGSPICLIKEDDHNRKWVYTDSNYKVGILEPEIKSIVTKQQFKIIEYEVIKDA